MNKDARALVADAQQRAAGCGLELAGDIGFEESGLDFRIGFATDTGGRRWVLRIPRRQDVIPKIEREARILDFVKARLPVQVPDWQVCQPELVAYPLLDDPMALELDGETGAVRWNIDRESPRYAASLGEVLATLHRSSVADATAAGIPRSSPEEVRANMLADVERVAHGIGMAAELEARCRRWIDDDRLWPDFSALTHGDLYAGHVTAAPDGRVSGIIDWTEAKVGDPSVDFSGHLAVFSRESLAQLVAAYAAAGGRTWPGMLEHIEARHAASPIAYGAYALETGSSEHLAGAKMQLGAGSVSAPTC